VPQGQQDTRRQAHSSLPARVTGHDDLYRNDRGHDQAGHGAV
jgi:hypothetical protein